MKKFLSIITVIAVVICNLPFTAFAAEEYAFIDFSSGTVPAAADCTNIDNITFGSDAYWESVTIDGVTGIRLGINNASGTPVVYPWINFDISRKYLRWLTDGTGVDITVEYYDEDNRLYPGDTGYDYLKDYTGENDHRNGWFHLTYDSRTAGVTPTEDVLTSGTNTWKTHTFHLYDAYFSNRNEGTSDFSLRLRSEFYDRSTSGIVLKSIKVEKSGKIFPLDITENITKTGNIYTLGAKPVISLAVKNILTTAVYADYVCTITNSHGEVVKTIEGNKSFTAGANTLNIATGLTACDTYDAKIVFTNDSNLYGEFKTNFSISVASDTNDSYGICTHYRMEGRDPEKSLPLAKQLGVSVSRGGIGWDGIETVKGDYKIPQHWLDYIDLANSMGVTVFDNLGFSNSLYNNGNVPQSDEDLKAYGDFVYYYVSALKGKVTYFEVGNEFHHKAYAEGLTSPDNGTRSNPPAEVARIYAKVQQTAYKRAKEANPDCKIVGLGGLTSVWDQWILKVFAELKKLDEADTEYSGMYMDLMSLHEYEEYNGPEAAMMTRMGRTKQHIIDYGLEDMPIWVSETGWSTSWTASSTEEQKYAHGIRGYVLFMEYGVDKYCWYDFKSDGRTVRDYQDNFGTIWANDTVTHVPYSARASYVAFSNMNDKLGNAEITNRVDYTNGAKVYEFTKANGEKSYVMWNITADTTITVSGIDTSKEWQLYDALGNGSELSVNSDGTCSVDVTDVPVYIALAQDVIYDSDDTTGDDTDDGSGDNTGDGSDDNPGDSTGGSTSVEKPEMGVYEIDYSTGDISVRASVLEPELMPSILVLKPGKTIDDILIDPLGATAYISQPANKSVFDFTFTAEEEGVYDIYVNKGSEIVKIGAAYYKPLGVEITVTQDGTTVTSMQQIDKTKPIKVTATIDNTYYSESPYMLASSLMNGNRMVTSRIAAKQLGSSVTSDTCELTIHTADSFDKIKIFVWRDQTRLIPLIDMIEW